jgi:RNA polymerase sigma factor (sigma-70 family)
MSQASVVELVTRAVERDEQAWREIIERYSGLVWSVTRACGLPQHRAADVVQTVWLRLVQHIGDLREPQHLGGWLATTARREAIRTIAIDRREDPQADLGRYDQADRNDDALDATLLRRERYDRLAAAMNTLTDRQRQLLRLLAQDPTPSYLDISAMTGMPIGSIGPTRARAIARLHSLLGVRPAITFSEAAVPIPA